MSEPETGALERGRAFVAAHGDRLQAACAAALVAGAGRRGPAASGLGTRDPGPRDALIEALAERFPPERDVAAALSLLAVLDDLRARDAEPARRASRALEHSQGRAGDWQLATGDGEDERLFATGMLAGYLAKTRYVRPEVLEAAGDFLAAHWTPARVKGGAWRPLAAYAHYFANAPHEHGDEVLQWCGRELERGFRTRHFDAVRTGRVFVYCDAGALPGAALRTEELLGALRQEQQPDGGWIDPADPAPAARLAHSLDALAVLGHLGERP